MTNEELTTEFGENGWKQLSDAIFKRYRVCYPVPDYVEKNVSTKGVKIIQSYTGVVSKMVWRKVD